MIVLVKMTASMVQPFIEFLGRIGYDVAGYSHNLPDATVLRIDTRYKQILGHNSNLDYYIHGSPHTYNSICDISELQHDSTFLVDGQTVKLVDGGFYINGYYVSDKVLKEIGKRQQPE